MGGILGFELWSNCGEETCCGCDGTAPTAFNLSANT